MFDFFVEEPFPFFCNTSLFYEKNLKEYLQENKKFTTLNGKMPNFLPSTQFHDLKLTKMFRNKCI